MRLNKSIERQLARIEQNLNPRRSERERVLLKAEERSLESLEHFIACINEVLDELEDDFYELVIDDLNKAEWSQIDIRMWGGFGGDNGLCTLTNAVLCLAAARHRGRQIPPIIPLALCEYFLHQPLEKFTSRSGGGGFRWLESGVKCEVCAYPLPAEALLCGGLYGVRQKRDEPGECEVLPFKRCPVCGGPVEWSVKAP